MNERKKVSIVKMAKIDRERSEREIERVLFTRRTAVVGKYQILFTHNEYLIFKF